VPPRAVEVSGPTGRVLGIDRFGASGKAAECYRTSAYATQKIAQQIRQLLEG